MRRLSFILFAVFLIGGQLLPAQSPEDFYDLGSDFFALGRSKKALKALNIAIEDEPDSAKYYFKRAEIHHFRFESAWALSDLGAALALDSSMAPAWYLTGEILSIDLQFGEAAAAFSQCLRFARDDSLALVARQRRAIARAYGPAPMDSVMKDWQDALDHGADSCFVLGSMGMIYSDSGKYARGLFLIEQAIDAAPRAPFGFMAMAYGLSNMKDFSQAYAYADSSLRLDPLYPAGWTQMNRILLETETPRKDLLRSAKLGVRLDPENPFAWRNLGLAYLQNNKRRKGCKFLQTALDMGFGKMFGNSLSEIQGEVCD